MPIDEALTNLINDARADGASQAAIEEMVVAVYRRYGLDPPPPITGTVAIAEPDDGFGK